MSISARERVIKAMPLARTFRAAHIADAVYPDLIRSDSEGRTSNKGIPVVARMLRRIDGVVELKHGEFYANREYFEDAGEWTGYKPKKRNKKRLTELGLTELDRGVRWW